MNRIKQLLQDRAGLARTLERLDLKEELPALVAAHDRFMLERLEHKIPLRSGGMFLLLDDVDSFRTRYFRTLDRA